MASFCRTAHRHTLQCLKLLISFAGTLLATSLAYGFEPTELTGLSAWWRADKGVTLDAGRATRWTDQGGQELKLTTWSPPVYVPGRLNGWPVLRFDGASFFVAADPPGAQSPLDFGNTATFFLVLKPSGSGNYTLLGKRGRTDEPNSFQWHLTAGQPGLMTLYGSTFPQLDGTPLVQDQAFQILELNLDVGRSGNDIRFYVQGQLAGASGDLAGGFALTDNQLTVCTEDWQGNNFVGDLAEAILYRRSLGDAERSQVGRYLSERYRLDAYGFTPPPIVRNPFPAPGEWPTYRANGSLNGHASGQGQIAGKPERRWTAFIGRIGTTLTITPDGGAATTVTVPAATMGVEPNDLAWDRRWYPDRVRASIGEAVIPVEPYSDVTFGDVLSAFPGWERFELNSGFTGTTDNPMRCLAWVNGAWATQWTSPKIPLTFGNYPLYGDFDNDGEPEVAAVPFYKCVVLNARTGQIEQDLNYSDGRNYGFFGAYDFNHDGMAEFLNVADHTRHLDVLGYQGGKFKVLWQSVFEHDIVYPTRLLFICPEPVADIDGDGQDEVLYNLYDANTDARWHLIIRNGMTGALKADLVDEFVQGTANIDGGNDVEAFTVRTSGQGIPTYGHIRLFKLKSGSALTLWEAENSAWQQEYQTLKLHRQNWNITERNGVMVRTVKGWPSVILRAPAAGSDSVVRLTALSWKDGSFQVGASITAPQAEGISLDTSGSMLVRLSNQPGKEQSLAVEHGQAQIVASYRKGIPTGANYPAPPVVAQVPGQGPLIVCQGSEDEIVAIEQRNGQPVERWRIKGHGQSYAWPDCYGPVVANLRGGATGRQLLYATESPQGNARLVCMDLATSATLWTHDFPDLPGSLPYFNRDSLTYFQAGYFTNPTWQDVAVTVRWMRNRNSTILLSGLDGAQIWRRDKELNVTQCGGQYYAVADFDGDGLDDLGSLYAHLRYFMRGLDGADIFAAENYFSALPISQPAYSGLALSPGDLATGPLLIWATMGTNLIGALKTDGKLLWSGAYNKAPRGYPAVGRFDAGGATQVMWQGAPDGLTCYDLMTGALKWKKQVNSYGEITNLVSADINGDGRDEALYFTANALRCIGTTSARDGLETKWGYTLPSPAGPRIGPPTLACLENGDTTGTRPLSLLATGQDGVVYCLGAPAAEPRSGVGPVAAAIYE